MRRGEASQEPRGTLLWAPLGLASEAGKGGGLAGWPSWPLGSACLQGSRGSADCSVVRRLRVNSRGHIPERRRGKPIASLGAKGSKCPCVPCSWCVLVKGSSSAPPAVCPAQLRWSRNSGSSSVRVCNSCSGTAPTPLFFKSTYSSPTSLFSILNDRRLESLFSA